MRLAALAPAKCRERSQLRSRPSTRLYRIGSVAPAVLFSLQIMEAGMTGILDKFHVEHGIHGARVIARSHLLTRYCATDDEADRCVQMLKDDLDACAREMKR